MDPTRAASPSTTSTSPTSSEPFLSPCQSAESMSSAELPRRKYPAHLSNGVPRSNQKYETMEELLAAAGYSVTRVFTPETERPKESGKDKKEEGIGGRVAGWFANILPVSSPSSPVDKEPEETSDKSQAARSLRTHLMTRALMRTDPPMLRHATSAPALSVPRSSRRRALPSAWREEAPAWSGVVVVKQPDQRSFGLSDDASRASTIRQSTVRANPQATIRANPHSTVRANPHLGARNPLSLRHRARSAPRPVPAPAQPVRPSLVVQQNVVVCRSVSSFGSSSSVQTRSSARSGSSDESCPVLTPEPATDGLPPTPSRPTIVRQRSGILRRERSIMVEVDDEPDLASIIHAYRPSSPRSTGRHASIRSLRALLKDPKFPDVPVVCVASPGTVSAGGPGRTLWLADD